MRKEKEMKCPKCGVDVPQNNKFCPECGEKLMEACADMPPVTPRQVPSQAASAQKKSKTKKILIISISAVVACAILFLILFLINPACIFGHRNWHKESKEPTCTEEGYTRKVCDDCGYTYHFPWTDTIDALGHDFGTIVCESEATCARCGEKQFLAHDADYTGYCTYCGQYEYTVTLPATPIVVNEYGSNNHIEASIVITDIKATDGYLGLEITYTARRTYHEDGSNMSARAEFAWKLYAPDGTVVDSSTERSDATIKMGEQCKDSFTLYGSKMEKWMPGYRLEIIHTR